MAGQPPEAQLLSASVPSARPAALDRALAPLDAARRVMWRLSARTDLGRRCIRDRSLRLGVMAVGHIVVACVLAIVAPLWLLLLGPLLLGVPHVVSDLRYLVVRPISAIPGRALLALGAGLAGMTLLRLGSMAGLHVQVEAELLCGLLATFGAVALSARRARAGAAAVGLCLVTGWAALAHPGGAVLVVAYGHNVVAIALWLWLARRASSWRHVAPAALAFVLASALILGGVADGLVPAVYLGDVGGLTLGQMTETLAPGVDPVWATRLVTWFAFSQAVHYVVWLRLVPQQQARRSVPPTWRRSARDLRADLGRLGFALAIGLSVAIPLWALVGSAVDVRALYLAVVLFHGWLEIGVFSALLTQAPRPAKVTV